MGLSILLINFQIYNWMPSYYTNTEELPAKMPLDLQNHIKSEKNMNPNSVSNL